MTLEKELNTLWNYSGFNKAQNIDISEIMHLVEPESPRHLYKLTLRWCELTGKKTIKQLAEELFKIQQQFTYRKFTLKQIFDYGIELFISRSYRGFQMERKVISLIQELFPTYSIHQDAKIDKLYRVDFCVKNPVTNKIIAFQVKPISYQFYKDDFKKLNNELNQKFIKDHSNRLAYQEVIYVYYKENKILDEQDFLTIIKDKL